MPSRNTRKILTPNCYYHIYNRGINKQNIFTEPHDYEILNTIFSRYLNPADTQTDADNIPYTKYNTDVEIQSYCFMSNHYHLLVWVGENPCSLTQAMQAIWLSYVRYFNKKYDRLGPLFQDRYKASPITSTEHLHHITRYIHLNPQDYLNYRYSSIRAYIPTQPALQTPGWLNPNMALSTLDISTYLDFLQHSPENIKTV